MFRQGHFVVARLRLFSRPLRLFHPVTSHIASFVRWRLLRNSNYPLLTVTPESCLISVRAPANATCRGQHIACESHESASGIFRNVGRGGVHTTDSRKRCPTSWIARRCERGSVGIAGRNRRKEAFYRLTTVTLPQTIQINSKSINGRCGGLPRETGNKGIMRWLGSEFSQHRPQ
ncbi:hypothetical protein N657DRAFT_92201 [Parathielavia appendiculata]|uniref:Uncharacterized protein n=1 Tax=Parathielavia appendiculata TaxID=2587402 RepID=A0AAN6Z9N1_9PEZI|nr:hypothetical protein N657DRAFT_92201 [Parathielavia appendiculata]